MVILPNLVDNITQEPLKPKIEELKILMSNSNNENIIKNGSLPLFLSLETQNMFKLMVDDFNVETPYRFIPKTDLLSHINTRSTASDFYIVKNQIIVIYIFIFRNFQTKKC